MMSDASQLILMIAPLLFAVTIHEVAHGYTAYLMGDDTAKMMGRLSLNPIKHLDPIGSVLLPLILKLTGGPIFGYAKPVPVNFNNLRDFRKGVILVSVAGVVANMICAVISGILFQLLIHFGDAVGSSLLETLIIPILYMLKYSVIINLVLAIFNLIPVPPLDGSKLLAMILPPDLSEQFQRIEPYGMIILILLLMTDVLDKIISFFLVPLSNILLGS
jgi:Zn-dependent protease